MNDACRTISVILQENGIVRSEGGYVIGRLTRTEEVKFDFDKLFKASVGRLGERDGTSPGQSVDEDTVRKAQVKPTESAAGTAQSPQSMDDPETTGEQGDWREQRQSMVKGDK